MSGDRVVAGFIPLVDAAPLLAARALGYARAEGVDLVLERETSWATLRDRLAVRHLDVAHVLAPMPIADQLGLTALPIDLVTPMALGFGGNTVTLSAAVASQLCLGAPMDAGAAARAFAALVSERAARGAPRLALAVVHPFSAHRYQLADWLGMAGIAPGRDVDLVVVPPSLMGDALAGGRIDGFCAGEPWGSLAEACGNGRVVATGAMIWPASPEKVLGVRRDWMSRYPGQLDGLIRAVHRAALWCDDPVNESDLAGLLSRAELLGRPAREIANSLARRRSDWGAGFLSYATDDALRMLPPHALRLYAQMVRWGQAALDDAKAQAVRRAVRPDLLDRALGVTAPVSTDDDEPSLDVADIRAYLVGVPTRA